MKKKFFDGSEVASVWRFEKFSDAFPGFSQKVPWVNHEIFEHAKGNSQKMIRLMSGR